MQNKGGGVPGSLDAVVSGTAFSPVRLSACPVGREGQKSSSSLGIDVMRALTCSVCFRGGVVRCQEVEVQLWHDIVPSMSCVSVPQESSRESTTSWQELVGGMLSRGGSDGTTSGRRNDNDTGSKQRERRLMQHGEVQLKSMYCLVVM